MEIVIISILLYLFIWPKVHKHNKDYFKKRMDDFKDWRNDETDAID